jgi:hypothetical protein
VALGETRKILPQLRISHNLKFSTGTKSARSAHQRVVIPNRAKPGEEPAVDVARVERTLLSAAFDFAFDSALDFALDLPLTLLLDLN